MDHVDVKWPDGEWRTALFIRWEIRGAMNKTPELWVDGRLYDAAPWRVVNPDGSIMVVVDPAAGTVETPHGRTPRDVAEVALLLTDQEFVREATEADEARSALKVAEFVD